MDEKDTLRQELLTARIVISEIFDAAFALNCSGDGTHLSRLCTDRLASVQQTLSYLCERDVTASPLQTKISYIDGDIFNSDADVICHQVNCKGAMGSGMALAVRTRYPEVFRRYSVSCAESALSANLLGSVQVVGTDDPAICGKRHIANLFAQYSYGDRHTLHTDYDALRKSLLGVKEWARHARWRKVAIPYGMGCVRGGGNWHTVMDIIRDTFAGTGLDIEIWALPKK